MKATEIIKQKHKVHKKTWSLDFAIDDILSRGHEFIGYTVYKSTKLFCIKSKARDYLDMSYQYRVWFDKVKMICFLEVN